MNYKIRKTAQQLRDTDTQDMELEIIQQEAVPRRNK